MARYEAKSCCGDAGRHGWGVYDSDTGDWVVRPSTWGRGGGLWRTEAEARAMAAALNGMGAKDLEICGNAMRGIAEAAWEEIERLRASYDSLTKRAHAEIKRLHDVLEALEKERDEARAELADARGALARWRQAAKEMLEKEASKPAEKCGAKHWSRKASVFPCVLVTCALPGGHQGRHRNETATLEWP